MKASVGARQNRGQWGPRDSVGLSEGQPAGFAGAKPRAQSLDGYLDLQRRVEDPRIRRAAPYTKRLVVHQFRVSAPEQLGEEFAGWVREAYQVAQGGHLGRQPKA